MLKLTSILFLTLGLLRAEVHTLNLSQAVSRALQQNSDLAMARLDERKAQEAVRQAKDPFFPKVAVGSGLAYSNGFPMSIEGSAPSIFQAQATESIFNRPQSYLVAQARENSRGAAIAVLSKRDEIALRTANLYLDAERSSRLAGVARSQIENLERVAEIVRLQVSEGRELPITSKRAELSVAQARYRVRVQDSESAYLEGLLATVLGFGPGDRVRPVLEDRTPPALPASEDEAVKFALENSKEVKRLESALLAKGFEISSQRSARLPRVDLVAQYAMFAKFNNYESFFSTFQRNNGQLGVSFQIPLLTGPGVEAAASEAEAGAAKLRLQVQATRNRISLDTRHDYGKVKEIETARDLAKLDLDVARDQVSVLLAQMGEGRATLRQIEEARLAESNKWIAYYESNYNLEKARLNLLSETGGLIAALR
jgi:outer membrane protein